MIVKEAHAKFETWFETIFPKYPSQYIFVHLNFIYGTKFKYKVQEEGRRQKTHQEQIHPYTKPFINIRQL